MTLNAVADALGVTHSNILHHFGSAVGLRQSLMDSMVQDLVVALHVTAESARSGELTLPEVLGQIFDTFNGGGRLAAWASLAGSLRELDPIGEGVRHVASGLAERADADGLACEYVAQIVMLTAFSAIGEAIVGSSMGKIFGASGAGRDAVTRACEALLASTSSTS